MYIKYIIETNFSTKSCYQTRFGVGLHQNYCRPAFRETDKEIFSDGAFRFSSRLYSFFLVALLIFLRGSTDLSSAVLRKNVGDPLFSIILRLQKFINRLAVAELLVVSCWPLAVSKKKPKAKVCANREQSSSLELLRCSQSSTTQLLITFAASQHATANRFMNFSHLLAGLCAVPGQK